MRVLVKERDSVLADLTFENEEVIIGCDSSCMIHLPDMRVSPKNAVLIPLLDGSWNIENLDPTNTVLVDGHVLTESKRLSDGDEIVLHDYLLKVYMSADLEQHVVEDVQLSADDLAKIRRYPLPAGSIVKRSFEGITLLKEQLDHASQLGVEVSHCRDLHDLIQVSLSLLIDVFDARFAWIGIRRQPHGELEVVGGKFPSGQVADTNPMIEMLQYRCCDRNQHICVRKVRDQQNIGSALAVPLSIPKGTFGMMYVDRAPGKKRFQIPDLDLLTGFGSTVAAKIHAILQDRQLRVADISSTEVNVAHTIQSQLDPRNIPSFPRIQIAAYGRSGQELPGDVYDVMKRPDVNITAFVLGHVRATGASLLLSMVRLHSTFRVAMLHNDPPHAFNREMNWLIFDQPDRAIIDCVCLLLDPDTGKIQYCRAGKIGAFVVDPHGQPRKLPAADGPSLGAVRGFEYGAKVDQLAPGETLAIYTRGVATATNRQGERFSEARFIQLVCDGFGQPPNMTIQDISHELTEFFQEGKHPDDISIVLIHFMPDADHAG